MTGQWVSFDLCRAMACRMGEVKSSSSFCLLETLGLDDIKKKKKKAPLFWLLLTEMKCKPSANLNSIRHLLIMFSVNSFQRR